MIEQDKYLNGKLYFNLFENTVYVKGVYWHLNDHAMDEKDILYFRKHINILHFVDNEKGIISAMRYNAHLHECNPIVDKLNALEWDGTPRIHRLLPRFLGADECDYTTAVTKMILYGAIQRIMHPGIKFDNCPILADKKQGTGKSTMCKFLALDDKYFCDNLDDMNDSDKAYRKIRTSWIVELGEMVATRNTKEVEKIKAFLSQTYDTYCEKYAIVTENIPRHTIFIGTTNKPEFLPYDPTGQRRFYPVICHGERAEVHPMENEQDTRAYIEQCYAEAMVTGEAEGWPLMLDKKYDEELKRMREASTPDDTRIPVIQQWLDDHEKVETVCTRMIYFDILNRDSRTILSPQKWELQELSDIMNLNIKGWKKYRSPSGDDRKRVAWVNGDYGVQRAWVRDVDTNVDTDVDTNVDKDGFRPATEEEIIF